MAVLMNNGICIVYINVCTVYGASIFQFYMVTVSTIIWYAFSYKPLHPIFVKISRSIFCNEGVSMW